MNYIIAAIVLLVAIFFSVENEGRRGQCKQPVTVRR